MARSVADAASTLSVTVVVVSLYPVSTVLLARVVLHERLSRSRIAAVALAVGAVALIGLGMSRA
jgi:drug/metabolite transporter (DMT)-like permease